MARDLKDIAYERLYELVQHYSSQLFRGRLAIITVCILIWTYILGVVEKGQVDQEIPLGQLILTTKMLLAGFSAFLMPAFASIENKYFKRFVDAGITARTIERTFNADLYFLKYHQPAPHPFIAIYVLNIVAFALTFLYLLWQRNGRAVRTLGVLTMVLAMYWLWRAYQEFLGYVLEDKKSRSNNGLESDVRNNARASG